MGDGLDSDLALAAIVERRDRDMVLVVGARTLRALYMLRALCKLAPFPNVTIIPVVSEAQTLSSAVRIGRPTDYMLALSSSDVVYTAGAPDGAHVKVRYGVGFLGWDSQKQSLDGRNYKRLTIGIASVAYARLQIKVSSPIDVTYDVIPGAVAVSTPPIPF